ncbi:hypothetical protein CCMA1212_000611 [Trichoderma ghanense]|uniref:Uncharacterized protein n=1 Tax=Trichoderma ghanense TaxID=65468 RepID=A0ABY2HJK9_9HYPO
METPMGPGQRFARQFLEVFDSLEALESRPLALSRLLYTTTLFYYDNSVPLSSAEQIQIL